MLNNNTQNDMKTNQTKLIAITVLAIVTVCLTFFAPLTKQVTEGFFDTYVKTVSLFGGINSSIYVVLTVLAGIGFVIFPIVGLVSGTGKGFTGAKLAGIFFLIMQVVCTVLSLQYYDDSSLFGALKSEVSQMTVHPMAIIAIVFSLVTWIMCLTLKKSSVVESVEEQ